MAGDRQLVRRAVAAYFGGTLNTTDGGSVYYSGGSLAASGLGTAWPYAAKGIPDVFFTQGEPAGTGWGAAMIVQVPAVDITRQAMGGPTSGWRGRHYDVTCELLAISYETHIETAEAAFDDLLDGIEALIYADRTLGTTSGSYPTGRLITQAGEGTRGIRVQAEPFTELGDKRGKYGGYGTLTFEVLTEVEA